MENQEIKKVNPFVEKIVGAWRNFTLPFTKFKDIYRESSLSNKVFIILNFIFNGIFDIKTKLFGRGLLFLIAEVALCLYIGFFPGFFIGQVSADFIWLTPVSYLFIVLYIVCYYQCFRKALVRLHRINNNIDINVSSLITGGKKFFLKIRRYFKELAAVYRYGKGITKFNLIASYFLIGLPQLMEKQFIKGICYLLIEAGFIAYMVLMGASSITNIINLGTYDGDRRQVVVYFVLTALLILFFAFVYFTAQRVTLNYEILRVNDKQATFKGELKDLSGKQAYFIYLILPILGAIAFTVIPIIFMILIAFTDWNGMNRIGNETFSWDGINSFLSLFDMGAHLSDLASVFTWTMIWSFFATFTCYFGGFFLAVLLNNKLVKIKPLWRSMFVIIMAVPQFVSLRVMNSLFSDAGPINEWITQLGGSPISFWTTPGLSHFLIIIINMWVGIPYNMLLISGLLLNIPKDNYEAAEIEGASKTQQFFKITFPYIFFMTTPLLITSFVNNINNFNVIFFLVGDGGGQIASTDIMITWLYKLTIMSSEYNIGSAIGIIMFIISATISLVIFRNSSAYKSEEEFR